MFLIHLSSYAYHVKAVTLPYLPFEEAFNGTKTFLHMKTCTNPCSNCNKKLVSYIIYSHKYLIRRTDRVKRLRLHQEQQAHLSGCLSTNCNVCKTSD